MSGIKSKNHELFTYESNKISLCDFNDKRYILDDGINTLPYGHKYIIKINKNKKYILFQYIRYLNMNEKEENRYLSYILLSIVENRNKKSENFQKAFKTFKNYENYKFIHPLIERHFLFKAIQELNEKVIKDKEGYLVDFTDRIHEYFNDQTIFYWRINGCINEDEILGINFVSKDFYFQIK